MSFEDAPENTARAERIRAFAVAHKAHPDTAAGVAIMTAPDGEVLMLDVEDLLAAAGALEALGVKGYAAARLSVKHSGYPSDLGDVALEAADTPDDTLRTLRQAFGDRVVDEMLDELSEQL